MGICLHVQILGLVVYLKQGDMLKLHVTTTYLSFGGKEDCEMCEMWRKKKKTGGQFWFPTQTVLLREDRNIGEITHCQSMKGSFFPEIVSLVLTSTCWPNTVMAGQTQHRPWTLRHSASESLRKHSPGEISPAGVLA